MIRAGMVAAALAAFLVAAAPARAACEPVTIYFGWNSAKVSDASKEALQRLALSLAWKGPDVHHILLTSHTDATGSPAANRAMALKRAEAVRDVLAGYHVPADLILVQAVGAQDPRVPTPNGVREPRNRRVELLVQLTAAGQARQLADGRPIC